MPGDFLAQFGKAAEESAAKEKAKRKAEDFDSEDENEEEWERRDAEKQREKRQKIEEQAKKTTTKYDPSKGFVLVNLEDDVQASEKDKPDRVTNEPRSNGTKAAGGTSSEETGSSIASSSAFVDAPKAEATKPKHVFGASSSIAGGFQYQPSSTTSAPDASKAELTKTKYTFGFTSGTTGESQYPASDTTPAASTSKANAERPEHVFGSTSGRFNDSQDKAQESTQTVFGSQFTSARGSHADVPKNWQAASAVFGHAGSAAASPSPPSSRGSSLFDQPMTQKDRQIRADNIFGHLSDVGSGAEHDMIGDADEEDSAAEHNKTGDADEEDLDHAVHTELYHQEPAMRRLAGVDNDHDESESDEDEEEPEPEATDEMMLDEKHETEAERRERMLLRYLLESANKSRHEPVAEENSHQRRQYSHANEAADDSGYEHIIEDEDEEMGEPVAEEDEEMLDAPYTREIEERPASLHHPHPEPQAQIEEDEEMLEVGGAAPPPQKYKQTNWGRTPSPTKK